MSAAIDPRLQRLLGDDRFVSLRKRLRRRFERAPLDAPFRGFRIDQLTVDEHAALASLLGRPGRYAGSLQVDVGRIDSALSNAGIAVSLRDALEQLDGPIAHLATTRLALQAMWSDVLESSTHDALIELLQTPAGMGLLKRLTRQNSTEALELCRRVEAVLQHLPASGMTRSQLAANALGDPHGLDGGQPAATLVLTIWRQLIARLEGKEDVLDQEDKDLKLALVDRDRDVWARAGVLVNELARPALFLNLPVRGTVARDRPPGEPAYVSLRSLLRFPPPWDVADRKVYICENPNLVAIAADHWGAGCEPLVCTDGMPAAAQRCLLSQLANARAQLCYHGDFDWPGVTIGNHVMREHGAQSWRFNAGDYEVAAESASELARTLTGKAVRAIWDGGLMAAMQRHQLSIAEEALASSLLEDLGPPR